VALNDDRNTIGRVNEDGTLTLDSHLLQPWIRGLHDLDSQTLACPLAGMLQAVPRSVLGERQESNGLSI
jgi:uncharacterized protein